MFNYNTNKHVCWLDQATRCSPGVQLQYHQTCVLVGPSHQVFNYNTNKHVCWLDQATRCSITIPSNMVLVGPSCSITIPSNMCAGWTKPPGVQLQYQQTCVLVGPSHQVFNYNTNKHVSWLDQATRCSITIPSNMCAGWTKPPGAQLQYQQTCVLVGPSHRVFNYNTNKHVRWLDQATRCSITIPTNMCAGWTKPPGVQLQYQQTCVLVGPSHQVFNYNTNKHVQTCVLVGPSHQVFNYNTNKHVCWLDQATRCSITIPSNMCWLDQATRCSITIPTNMCAGWTKPPGVQLQYQQTCVLVGPSHQVFNYNTIKHVCWLDQATRCSITIPTNVCMCWTKPPGVQLQYHQTCVLVGPSHQVFNYNTNKHVCWLDQAGAVTKPPGVQLQYQQTCVLVGPSHQVFNYNTNKHVCWLDQATRCSITIPSNMCAGWTKPPGVQLQYQQTCVLVGPSHQVFNYNTNKHVCWLDQATRCSITIPTNHQVCAGWTKPPGAQLQYQQTCVLVGPSHQVCVNYNTNKHVCWLDQATRVFNYNTNKHVCWLDQATRCSITIPSNMCAGWTKPPGVHYLEQYIISQQ